MQPLIAFDHVSFRYQPGEGPAIQALDDVSLSIVEGEFVALVGANGSGKSTFARLVNALLIPQSGTVSVLGLDTQMPENRARIHAAVGMVFQYPEDQVVAATVEDDVAFGPANLGLPTPEIQRRVEQALNEVGLLEHRGRPSHLLSAGQTQRLALAGVLAMHPRCIIFDEASTMLDPAGRRMLLDAMQRLHREGLTILFITHFMDEAALAERMIVFHRGKVALDGTVEQVFGDPGRLKEYRLDLPPAGRAARLLRGVFTEIPHGILTLPPLLAALPAYEGRRAPAWFSPTVHLDRTPPEALIDVAHLGYVYLKDTAQAQRALEDVSMQVMEKQVHGLLGMTGSGKSTLMQHLNALLRPQEGQVRVGRFNLNNPRLDRREVIRQVGLVFQNPETQFFEHFVGDEIAFGPRQFGVTDLAGRVQWAMDQVGLDFETYKDRPLFALSGGERRKVALASTLALQPAVLLLDEPTAGLDPLARLELLERLSAMRDSGMTLVLSSHQMEDMARLAHALTVFHKGRVALSAATATVFGRHEELRAYGLEPPVAMKIAEALRQKGWPVAGDVLTLHGLADHLAAVRKETAG